MQTLFFAIKSSLHWFKNLVMLYLLMIAEEGLHQSSLRLGLVEACGQLCSNFHLQGSQPVILENEINLSLCGKDYDCSVYLMGKPHKECAYICTYVVKLENIAILFTYPIKVVALIIRLKVDNSCVIQGRQMILQQTNIHT